MLIFAACLAIFVYGMVASMLGTINPGLAAKFQLTNVQTGYIALAQGIGLVIASVSVGPLLDRKGKKVGLLLGLGLVTLSLLALANAASFEVIAGAMVVLGMGGGIIITGANALGSDVSESRRASVLNFLNVFVGLGGFATPFIAGNLLGGDAVRVAYTAAALTGATLARPPVPAHRSSWAPCAPGRRRARCSASPSCTSSQPRPSCTPPASSASGTGSRSTWSSAGFPPRRRSTSCRWVSRSACSLVESSLPRSSSRSRRSRSPSCRPTLMALTTFAVLHVSAPALVGPLVFLAGIAMAPVFPTTIAMVADVFKERSGTAIGFTITCGFSGLVVSSPLIGWLAGPDPAGLGTGLLVLPVFSAALVVVYLVLRSKRRAALESPSPSA